MELSRTFPLDCLDADEVVPGLLELMAAPKRLPSQHAGGWLGSWRGWLSGGLAGVVFGCVAYTLSLGSTPRTAAAPVLALPAAPALAAPPARAEAPRPAEPESPEAPAAVSLASAVPAVTPETFLGSRPDPRPVAGPKLVAGPGRPRSVKAGDRPLSPAYRALLRTGWQRYGAGRFDTAAVAFGRAIHLEERQSAGYYGLALALFEQGSEDAALNVLARGAERTGSKSELWLLAGSIYQWKGKERLARAAYTRYLTDHPRGPFARDVRVILAYESLPALLPFGDQESSEMLADTE
jgi:hypothetical protein